MNNFFSEFNTQNKAGWIEAITKKLKGKDFTSLQTQTYEGITLFPFYNRENKTKQLLQVEDFGEKSWENIVEITPNGILEKNIKIALDNGVDTLFFDLENADITSKNILKLIENQGVKTIVKINSKQIEELVKSNFKGIIFYDILGENFIKKESIKDEYWDKLVELITWANTKSDTKVLSISTLGFINAGANAVQELAFGISILVEYFDKLTDKGFDVKDLAKQISFSLGIGENYFIELAKFRALRVLWKEIVKHFQIDAKPLFIQASNTTRNKAELDAYNNILRTTTEAMSAIIGGANAIKVLPYNATFEAQSDFSKRIARNISLILNYESHLDKAKDFGAGSYYIEYLTETLAKQAWVLFQTIEEKGGFSKAQSFIHSEIEKIQKLRQANFESQKDVLVGVNKYQR